MKRKDHMDKRTDFFVKTSLGVSGEPSNVKEVVLTRGSGLCRGQPIPAQLTAWCPGWVDTEGLIH